MGSGCTTCHSFKQKLTQNFQNIKEIEQAILSIQSEMAEDSMEVSQLLKSINEQLSYIPNTSLDPNQKENDFVQS